MVLTLFTEEEKELAKLKYLLLLQVLPVRWYQQPFAEWNSKVRPQHKGVAHEPLAYLPGDVFFVIAKVLGS